MPSSRLTLALVVASSWAGMAPAQAPAPEPPPATSSPVPSPAAGALEAGDAAWERRAEGSSGGTALAGPVDEAIAAYRKALEAEPSSLDARWRLMRALYFKGEHTTKDTETQKKIFDDGKVVGEEALVLIRKAAGQKEKRSFESASPVQLAPLFKGDAAVTECFLWASIDWGKWALVFGKSQAVKKGAAGKIRDYATAVIALDPRFEDAAGYRVLGRLHHQTPSVPFFTGWASRDDALKYLRLAVKEAPRSFINRLYLAEAMWEYEKPSRDQARKALETLIAETPSTSFPVEDHKTQEDARALLSAWTKR